MGIAEEQMARDEEARPGCRESPFSVLQLVRGTNRVLDRVVGTVWVEGEVTALTRASSGHIYFSLSDEGASVRAAMWRSDARRLKFDLKQGQRVVCRGRLGVYERDGKMQMYVQTAEPAGLGSEALALAQSYLFFPAELGLLPPKKAQPFEILFTRYKDVFRCRY